MQTVTKEIALKVVLMGACRIPKIGSNASSFSTSALIWAEDHDIKIENDLPLWVLSSGYGNGYGAGYEKMLKSLQII